MPRIHVCALSRIHATVEATGARALVTLINIRGLVVRPSPIHPDAHLVLGMSDIIAPTEGEILPAEAHVRELLAFVEKWDRANPLIIHCYAGVSRSTAAAFIAACALDPARAEHEIAWRIRALSPTATPNSMLVEIADGLMNRAGRMNAAVSAIGRGVECFEGVPFALDVPPTRALSRHG
jgi:predicted protein tyrosine phosphatase